MLVCSGVQRVLKVWDLEGHAGVRELCGHTQDVLCTRFTADNRLIVSGSDDATLKLWDVTSGKCMCTFQGHTKRVCSLAICPDGKRMVSASDDHTLRLWELQTGKCLMVFQGHTHNVRSVMVCPNNNHMVSGSYDGTAKLWNLTTGQCVRTMQGHRHVVHSVAVTRNGSQLVTSSEDNTLRVWDLQDGQCQHVFEGHTSGVYRHALSPDNTRMLSLSSDHTIRLWDLQTGKCMHVLDERNLQASSVTLCSDGKSVVYTDDKDLKLIDLERQEIVKRVPLQGPVGVLLRASNIEDSSAVVSAFSLTSKGTEKATSNDCTPPATDSRPADPVTSSSSSSNAPIQLHQKTRITTSNARNLQLHRSKPLLLYTSDNELHIVDLQASKFVCQFKTARPIVCASFASEDPPLLLFFQKNVTSISFVNYATTKVFTEFRAHTNELYMFEVHPTRNLLLTCGKVVKVWNLNGLKQQLKCELLVEDSNRLARWDRGQEDNFASLTTNGSVHFWSTRVSKSVVNEPVFSIACRNDLPPGSEINSLEFFHNNQHRHLLFVGFTTGFLIINCQQRVKMYREIIWGTMSVRGMVFLPTLDLYCSYGTQGCSFRSTLSFKQVMEGNNSLNVLSMASGNRSNSLELAAGCEDKILVFGVQAARAISSPPRPSASPTSSLPPEKATAAPTRAPTVLTNTTPATKLVYAPTPQEISAYLETFTSKPKSLDGRVSNIIVNSGLIDFNLFDDEQREAIVRLADRTNDDQCDEKEFVIAYHLAVCVGQRGMPLPSTLPPELENLTIATTTSSPRGKSKSKSDEPAASTAPCNEQQQRVVSRQLFKHECEREDNAGTTFVDLHPSESWILVAFESGKLKIWNYESQTLWKEVQVTQNSVRVARFVPRQAWILVYDVGMAMHVVGYPSMQTIKRFSTRDTLPLYLDIHGTKSLVLTCGNELQLWDWNGEWKTTAPVRKFVGHQVDTFINMVKWNPSEAEMFATACDDKSVGVWTLQNTSPLGMLRGVDQKVKSLDFYCGCDAQPRLVAGYADGKVVLWNYQSREQLQTLQRCFAVAHVLFDAVLNVVFACDDDVKILDSDTLALKAVVKTSSIPLSTSRKDVQMTKLLAVRFNDSTTVLQLDASKLEQSSPQLQSSSGHQTTLQALRAGEGSSACPTTTSSNVPTPSATIPLTATIEKPAGRLSSFLSRRSSHEAAPSESTTVEKSPGRLASFLNRRSSSEAVSETEKPEGRLSSFMGRKSLVNAIDTPSSPSQDVITTASTSPMPSDSPNAPPPIPPTPSINIPGSTVLPPPPPSSPSKPHQTLRSVRIEGVEYTYEPSSIAANGRNEVYKAFASSSIGIPTPVVLKMYNVADASNANPRGTQLREREALTTLVRANANACKFVVEPKAFDANAVVEQTGSTAGAAGADKTVRSVLVMEPGKENLKQIIDDSGTDLSPEMMKSILLQVSRCMEFVHSQHFVYCDLKPENVVDFGARWPAFKLVDFENCRRLNDELDADFTTEYCPPEMASYWADLMMTEKSSMKPKPLRADFSFDVWSFGVLCMKVALRNRPLLEFLNQSEQEMLAALAKPSFTFDRTLRHLKLSSPLEDLIRKCLERDPNKRPTFAEIARLDVLVGYTTKVHTMVETKQSMQQLVVQNKQNIEQLSTSLRDTMMYVLKTQERLVWETDHIVFPVLWMLVPWEETDTPSSGKGVGRRLLKKFQSLKLSTLTNKDMELRVLCDGAFEDANDIVCAACPERYRIRISYTREFIRKSMPVLRGVSLLLKLAGAVGGILGLGGLGTVGQKLAEVMDLNNLTESMEDVLAEVKQVAKDADVTMDALEDQVHSMVQKVEQEAEKNSLDQELVATCRVSLQAKSNEIRHHFASAEKQQLIRELLEIANSKKDWSHCAIIGGLQKVRVKQGEKRGAVQWVCANHAQCEMYDNDG